MQLSKFNDNSEKKKTIKKFNINILKLPVLLNESQTFITKHL